MRLKSKRIRLEPLEDTDIDRIHAITSNYAKISEIFPTVIRSKVSWKDRFAKTGLWDENYGMLKIIDTKDSELCGVIWYFKGLSYSLGYELGFNIFDKEKRLRGFAADAVQLLSGYMFKTYNINRLQCNTLLPKDHPSIDGFTQKTGFVYEGTMRKAMFVRGEFTDLNLFSLLREDCLDLDDLTVK